RFTTSVGGTLTGRGCNFMIIDDPSKADDAHSVVALQSAIDWFRNTALTRLDHPPTSVVIVTMQRLHVNDLSGVLIDSGWAKLVLPAIANGQPDSIRVEGEIYIRAIGQLLKPVRDTIENFEEIKRDLESRVFAAQYQQNPPPPEGNMIKSAWLPRYAAQLARD